MKHIVITGVSRGLGRALVEGFAKEGRTISGCARDKKAIDALTEKFGDSHRFAVVDVTEDAQVCRWAQEVISAVGPPDLLINNAGLINNTASLWEVPEEEFSRVIDVNLKGIANTIRHFTPAMIGRGSGVIANLSSGWGRSVSAEVAPYCATKWGVEGLTLALAEEMPAGLAAVSVNPGVIDTDMLRQCWGAAAGSYPPPQEWAKRAVSFFLNLGPDDNGRQLTVQ